MTEREQGRYIGVDVGAEAIKLVELERSKGQVRVARRALVEHHKAPGPALLEALRAWDWDGEREGRRVTAAAATGRLSRAVDLVRIPAKQAQARGCRFLHGDEPTTVVSIGSHGFSVLELHAGGVEILRENSRCSQGTGNFLRQLVERFDLDIDGASALCADIADPAPLSGRCPVILKTDMTHLANKGESRAHILAGLFDAVCENVTVLLKPRLCPPRLALVGGVARSPRVRAHFRRLAATWNMTLLEDGGDDFVYYEAIGCALEALDRQGRTDGADAEAVEVPALDQLLVAPPAAELDHVPGLSGSLKQVHRMTAPPPRRDGTAPLILGFDIGSTGSKVVAIDVEHRDPVWSSYVRTNGDPVSAAQTLMRSFAGSELASRVVIGLGATGSGREIVGSLLSSCYGADAVYVLNEIAAHAEGATHYDPTVDTIFEIGGQDAKYIRLSEGRVVDAAMNEACSAGTGSFIEEQGRRFEGIRDVVQLGHEACASDSGVSLGQHCSVFMAEIIDEAVAAGVPRRQIVSGIYDSIIQNYLNRVKGSRSVGQVIFCQGMPFASDALAAAVARQTQCRVIVPPDPGTVGALGIALLSLKHRPRDVSVKVDPSRFLGARVERKDTFVCKATEGCGGAGNRCRIDRIATLVPNTAGEVDRKRFTWGGGCSLWDKGTRRAKLPDRAPDPFREREELIAQLVARLAPAGSRPRIAITDEFLLKSLFPFFATFLHELGFDLVYRGGADHGALKRGIEQANVPFCAPMQQYHGLAAQLAEEDADYLFLPMLRELPRSGGERDAVVCPIVQASPDILSADLGAARGRVLSPVIDMGRENLRSTSFMKSCVRLATSLGVLGGKVMVAHQAGLAAQEQFDAACRRLGREAIDYCQRHAVLPVVVLGRSYTIYNRVLNSNVPAILREQGALAIPSDCYPPDEEAPVFGDIFWGYAQQNLRAAHQIRRSPGVYSLYCSNYSCGPDSFNLHFYGYIMEGKPFAVIETDGHSGDAGTKTRVEAFLHCVREDLSKSEREGLAQEFAALEARKALLPDVRVRGERVLLPRMGPGAEALAAVLRGAGVPAEALPIPTRETLRLGRRYTSGKECVPMTITLGSLLERLDEERGTSDHFAFFMPTAEGPCRFGVYNLLHKITLERLGWGGRVRVWSPSSSGYFDGIPAGISALAFAGFMASDLLLDALHDVRPVESHPGAAQAIHERFQGELLRLMEREGAGDLRVPATLLQVATGRVYGVLDLLRRAGRAFAAVKRERDLPTVALVGEIYVRLDPFANDFIVEKLEKRGLRVKLAPFNEWLEYTDHANFVDGRVSGIGARVSNFLQTRIQDRTTAVMAEALGWPARTTVKESLAASSDYLREALVGEAVLTLGGPLHEWRTGHIEGVVSVGPHECMPNKIAETQLFHAGQREGIPSLTLPLNGDPIDPEVIDNFAFEIHARHRKEGDPVGRADGQATGRAGLTGHAVRSSMRLRPPGKLVPAARLVRGPSPRA